MAPANRFFLASLRAACLGLPFALLQAGAVVPLAATGLGVAANRANKIMKLKSQFLNMIRLRDKVIRSHS